MCRWSGSSHRLRDAAHSIVYPPKLLSSSLEGYVNLFTTCMRQTPEYMGSRRLPQTRYDRLVRSRDIVIERLYKYVPRLVNSP